MFIGHYAVGFVLKKKFNEIPLWLIFLSVQFVDILAFSFVLLGFERIKYNPSTNPFLRTIIEYVPYSHSLFANVLLAFIVFLIFWRIKNEVWGMVLMVGVLSHWLLDVLVHVSDMPLFHNSLKVGFGLWQFPWIAFFIELSMFTVAGYYLLKNYHKVKKHIFLIILLSIGFSMMFFAPEAEAAPVLASIFSLIIYTVSTMLAYWCER